VYFSAHPVDSLLYQNPDLYHDIYVYKCITTVVITSGDRGVAGNFSENLERGLEAAYAHMAGLATNRTVWAETSVTLGQRNVTVRFLKDVPNIQIVYLRIPDGDSLKKLYSKKIVSVTTTDRSTVYSLEALKALVATVLKQKAPRDIRVLDFKSPIPQNDEHKGDHADHVVSAMLVLDAVKHNGINSTVLG
jgi:hypothetical protein